MKTTTNVLDVRQKNINDDPALQPILSNPTQHQCYRHKLKIHVIMKFSVILNEIKIKKIKNTTKNNSWTRTFTNENKYRTATRAHQAFDLCTAESHDTKRTNTNRQRKRQNLNWCFTLNKCHSWIMRMRRHTYLIHYVNITTYKILFCYPFLKCYLWSQLHDLSFLMSKSSYNKVFI